MSCIATSPVLWRGYRCIQFVCCVVGVCLVCVYVQYQQWLRVSVCRFTHKAVPCARVHLIDQPCAELLCVFTGNTPCAACRFTYQRTAGTQVSRCVKVGDRQMQ